MTSRAVRCASMSRKSARAAVAAAVVVIVVIAVIAAVTVAEAAVAADDSSAALDASVTTSATDASASSHDPQPANSNVRAARGTGNVARAAAPDPAKPVVAVPPELSELAATIGQAWAQVMVQSLEAQGREIVGAWPGTLREARRQVLAKLRARVEPEQLDQLAKLTNLAARRGWESVSEPDLES